MVAQETQSSSSSSSSCTVVVPTAAATARGLDGRSGPRQRDGAWEDWVGWGGVMWFFGGKVFLGRDLVFFQG